MFIEFIKEEKLKELKSNINDLYEYFGDDDNTRLLNELGNNIFEESQFDIEPFELNIGNDKKKPYLSDSKNAVLLYKRLKGVSNSIASDERLWAGLCIGPFWKYTQQRWDIKNKLSPDSIKQHFLFAYNTRRSFTRNAIARLWWSARLTYDENLPNQFELTEFACKYSRYVGDFFERNFSNNHTFVKSFFQTIIELNKKYSLSTDHVRDLIKYIDEIGGMYILDCLSEQIIKDKICKKVEQWHKQDKVKLA